MTTLPSVFCSKSKHGENLKTVSFSLLFPQNVPLEMMNANLTTLPISFEVAKEFHTMCGNDKKTLILPKRFNISALFHWTREGSFTIVPNVFCPNSETKTFVKVFKKMFSSKSFSGRVKVIFDRLVETTLAKRYTTLLLKVRN